MYLFAQNRVQKYSGAVAARPCAGFGRDIGGLTPNLVLTWVVTAPDQPPRYVIDMITQPNLYGTRSVYVKYMHGICINSAWSEVENFSVTPSFLLTTSRGFSALASTTGAFGNTGRAVCSPLRELRVEL